MEEIIKNRDSNIDEIEKNLKYKENNIKELESMNNFSKIDYNFLKGNYEILNIKFAEIKVVEANLNIELNKRHKEIGSLQKDIGTWEIKFEQKEQESFEMRRNYEIQIKLNSENEKKILGFTKEIENFKENEKKFEDFKMKNYEILTENEHLRREIAEIKENNHEDQMKGKRNSEDKRIGENNAYEHTIMILEQQINELERNCEGMTEEIIQYKHLLALNEIEKDNNFLEKTRKVSFPQEKNLNKEGNIQKKNVSDKNQQELKEIQNPDIPIQEISKTSNKNIKEINVLKEILKKPEYSEETPIILQNKFILNVDSAVQTENQESSEILMEYLREREVNSDIWSEIYEFIEKKSQKKEEIIFNPKANSRKESFSNSRQNSLSGLFNLKTPKPSNYSNIMGKILIQNSEFPLITESDGLKSLRNVDSKPRIKLNLSLENPIFNPVNQNQQKNPQKAQYIPQNLKSSSLVIKQHHIRSTDGSLSQMQQSPKQFLNKQPINQQIEQQLPQKNFEKKKKRLSASSSNLNSILIKIEETPKASNFRENTTQQLWELPKEEKDVVFGEMYQGFTRIQESLLASQSNHRNYLKHVVLIKHMRKEIYGETDGNNQMPTLEEFKEFIESMLMKHRKCGKDCSHLKRFYEKVGWNSGDRGFENRIQFIPKTMIINTLPKI